MSRPVDMKYLAVLLIVFILCPGGRSRLLHHMNYDDIEDYKDHPCRRPCQDNQKPMTCDYNFLLEHYHILTKACWNCPYTKEDCSRPHCVPGDGGLRGIITANRMMPGPSIHVCENDIIRVRVDNKMENSEGTSLHWHGIHQLGSPYMDGVGMVTQCPIPAHAAFTYVFNASTPGTHFWHAHSGLQRADGLYGHLVIHQPPSRDHHYNSYDFDLPEHTFVVIDWWNREVAPSFAQHHHSDGPNKPTSILINGKGTFADVFNSKTGQNATTPRESFNITQGYRYRFRAISAGILLCPIQISVDSHMLQVIASDGSPVEKMEVESFVLFPGERYDFILTANQRADNYLLRAQGLLDCSARFHDAKATAILHYEGAQDDPTFMTPAPPLNGKVLNPPNSVATTTKIPVSHLRSMADDDVTLIRKPDRVITLAMDFSVIDNPRFHNKDLYSTRDFPKYQRQLQTPQINSISTILPPAPPLSQLSDLPKDMLCNNDTVTQDCTKEYCECIHLYKIKLGHVVELIMVDQGHIWDANHPTHLHGHGFRVVAMDKLADSIYAHNVTELDDQGRITRNLQRAPIKDTVSVPDGGYTIVRFHANNPGFWFLHCHIEYHAEIGMGLLFQVGEESDFPPVPARFPTCGSWEPGLDFDAESETKREQDPDPNEGLGPNDTAISLHPISLLLCSVLLFCKIATDLFT